MVAEPEIGPGLVGALNRDNNKASEIAIIEHV